jgi:Esterase/lipase
MSLSAAMAQPVTELLWPEGAPGALGSDDKDKPSLTRYLADPATVNGTAVVVCPGGGYSNLAMDHEGKQIAEWLNKLGISAFVLKYRLGPKYHHPIELQDAQRALRTVRSRAQEFHVAPNRIGIWGFSAGGHLASTAGTHFDSGDAAAPSPDGPRELAAGFHGSGLSGDQFYRLGPRGLAH